MPSMIEIRARVRAAHLLVRSAEEWDALSEELLLAYESKDNDLAEKLRESFLAAWKAVTRNLLSDAFDAAGISIGPAAHPWGIATLGIPGRRCEPLLRSPDELPEALGDATVHGGPHLRSFEEVMAGYDACLTFLFRRSGGNIEEGALTPVTP